MRAADVVVGDSLVVQETARFYETGGEEEKSLKYESVARVPQEGHLVF